MVQENVDTYPSDLICHTLTSLKYIRLNVLFVSEKIGILRLPEIISIIRLNVFGIHLVMPYKSFIRIHLEIFSIRVFVYGRVGFLKRSRKCTL